MKQYYVGTSGFQYKDWTKTFYPDDVPQRQWLEFYASNFNTLEMNSTFYRLPNADTFAKWRNRTPENFVFAIKGSRFVTHQKRLIDPYEPVNRLFEGASKLGPKLGVVLWQFAGNFRRDTARLEGFIAALQANKTAQQTRQAFEFRHDSWFDESTYRLLRDHDYALVINQSSVWPSPEIATASWTYVRFHGPRELYSSGYSKRQLTTWAGKIKNLTKSDSFIYFNNDNGNFAPWNAQDLRERL